jgi:hypothetical protein
MLTLQDPKPPKQLGDVRRTECDDEHDIESDVH